MLAILMAAATPAHPATSLTEAQATHKAVDYLRGGAYGDSYFDVIQHIKETKLVPQGMKECGPLASPAWAFRVENPYKGWLFLDAATGEKQCSSIPFLR